MDRWLIALLVGLAGGVGGGLGVHFLLREAPVKDSGAAQAGADDATLRQIREDIAALAAKIDRRLAEAPPPGPTTLGPSANFPVPAARAGAGASPSGGLPAMTQEQLEALMSKAADAAIAKQAEREAALKPPEKKKATLAEVARELSLPASAEDEIRRAYADANEKYVKLMAEPEGDVEAVKREVEAAKGDETKKAGLMMKYLPKVIGKLPDLMAIESERTARVHKALGPENIKKFDEYNIEDSSPFGLDANVSISGDR